MKYSEKLVMLRKLRSLTQQELADAVSISVKTLQRIENGSSQLTKEMEERIAKALRLTKEEVERFEVNDIFHGLKGLVKKVEKEDEAEISPAYVSFLEKTFLDLNRENIYLKHRLEMAKESGMNRAGNTNLFHS